MDVGECVTAQEETHQKLQDVRLQFNSNFGIYFNEISRKSESFLGLPEFGSELNNAVCRSCDIEHVAGDLWESV